MDTLRLGTSTYSYWHFTKEVVPVEYVLEQAHKLGLAGVEILQRQLASEETSYLQGLKRLAFNLGLDLYNLSIHQDFIWPEAAERQRHIDHTLHCIDVAHAMGIPSIRINSGSWRKTGSFAELIAAGGHVDPWPSYTDDDAFEWVIASIKACLPRAEEKGVMLLLENHWGLTTTPEGMLRILEGVNSPWLGAILDAGNFYFMADMYDAMEKIAPYVRLAHAKTYPGGGDSYTLDLDYPRIFGILKQAGFTGYVSIEMEGYEVAETAVPKSIEQLETAWQAAMTPAPGV